MHATIGPFGMPGIFKLGAARDDGFGFCLSGWYCRRDWPAVASVGRPCFHFRDQQRIGCSIKAVAKAEKRIGIEHSVTTLASRWIVHKPTSEIASIAGRIQGRSIVAEDANLVGSRIARASKRWNLDFMNGTLAVPRDRQINSLEQIGLFQLWEDSAMDAPRSVVGSAGDAQIQDSRRWKLPERTLIVVAR